MRHPESSRGDRGLRRVTACRPLDIPGEAESREHPHCVQVTSELVDAFYRAAIATGGQDNGGPGLRPQYNPNYYSGFVLDPDGYNIEAVCREAE
jgi:hypothetical protein